MIKSLFVGQFSCFSLIDKNLNKKDFHKMIKFPSQFQKTKQPSYEKKNLYSASSSI